MCELQRDKIPWTPLGVAVATREASLFVVPIGAASFPGPVRDENGRRRPTENGDEYTMRDVGERACPGIKGEHTYHQNNGCFC